MRILNIKPRTKEWYELRASKIGASDCAPVLGKSSFNKTPHKIWEEKNGFRNTFATPSMQRGNELEPEAREFFNQKFKTKFEEIVALDDHNEWQMASLDGWNGEIVLEIKCPGLENFEKACNGDINEDYLWQVQHQLAVSGAKKGILAFYAPQDRRKSFEVYLDRDEAMIDDLIAKERAFFENYLVNFEEPPLSKGDFVVRDDSIWEMAAQNWLEAKERLKEAEELEGRLKKTLIELSEDQPSKGCGVTTTKSKRDGGFSIKSMPQELQELLAPYKKPDSYFWKVLSSK